MPPSYSIRHAEIADLTCLPAIEQAAATLFPDGRLPDPDDTMPMEELEDAQCNKLLWVAALEDVIVGFAMCNVYEDLLHLAVMAVHPDHGQRGVGTQLVHAVADQARRHKMAGITLTTFSDLAWNAPFYAKVGFRVLAPSELNPMLQDILVQEKRLGMTNRIAMLYETGL